MKLVDEVIGWLLIVLGTSYCAFTPRPLTLNALWFFGNGMFLITVGFVNLARIKYAGAAPGIRWLAFGINVAVLAFSVVITIFSHRPFGPPAFCAVLTGLAMLFALLPQAAPKASAQGAA
jgi:hypothetical protein